VGMLGRMRAIRWLVLVLGGCGITPPQQTPSYADDRWLECSLGERGVVTGPVELASVEGREAAVVGEMTEEHAQAKRLFNSEKWADARRLFARVIQGQTGDDLGNRQHAEYHAAICDHRLGDPRAALTGFDLISRDPLHQRHNEALLWIAKLMSNREITAAAMDLVLRYDEEQIARFDNAQQRELYGLLHFATGRAWYRRGDPARALAALERVPPETTAASLARSCRMMVR
jgi:hypothetical protein